MYSIMKKTIVALALSSPLTEAAAAWHSTTSSKTTSTSSALPEATYCTKGQKFNKYTLAINFDNITTVPADAFNPIPEPYNLLYFQAFTAIGVVNTGVQTPGVPPHSLPNLIAAGLVSETEQGDPSITTQFTGSIAKAIDLLSFFYACSLNTANSVVGVPTGCYVGVTGYSGPQNSGSAANEVCSYQYEFQPSTTAGVQQMAFTQPIKGCSNAQYFIFTVQGTGTGIAAGSALGLLLDNVDVNVYTCN